MRHQKPLVIFDCETTGTNTATDRIVSIYGQKMYKGALEAVLNLVINPGIPIPEEASSVHGITNEVVAGEPTFKEAAQHIFDFFAGCDVGGFNIINFDVPLLCEEFARAGFDWPTDDVRKIDACSIYRIKESRTLTAAMRFYCNEEMEGAHDAGNDVRATAKVLAAQLEQYEDLAAMSPAELEAFCTGGVINVDVAGKIVLDANGIPVYAFGKDKGLSVQKNPGFAEWMLGKDFPANTKAVIRKLIKK